MHSLSKYALIGKLSAGIIDDQGRCSPNSTYLKLIIIRGGGRGAILAMYPTMLIRSNKSTNLVEVLKSFNIMHEKEGLSQILYSFEYSK